MKCRKMLFSKKRECSLWILYAGIFIVIATILAGSTFFANRTKAAEKMNDYKYYTSVEIKHGDTLWSIASEYVTEEYDNLLEYVMEIKCLNGLKGDTIHSGQFLVVPYYSCELK